MVDCAGGGSIRAPVAVMQGGGRASAAWLGRPPKLCYWRAAHRARWLGRGLGFKPALLSTIFGSTFLFWGGFLVQQSLFGTFRARFAGDSGVSDPRLARTRPSGSRCPLMGQCNNIGFCPLPFPEPMPRVVSLGGAVTRGMVGVPWAPACSNVARTIW